MSNIPTSIFFHIPDSIGQFIVALCKTQVTSTPISITRWDNVPDFDNRFINEIDVISKLDEKDASTLSYCNQVEWLPMNKQGHAAWLGDVFADTQWYYIRISEEYRYTWVTKWWNRFITLDSNLEELEDNFDLVLDIWSEKLGVIKVTNLDDYVQLQCAYLDFVIHQSYPLGLPNIKAIDAIDVLSYDSMKKLVETLIGSPLINEDIFKLSYDGWKILNKDFLDPFIEQLRIDHPGDLRLQ